MHGIGKLGRLVCIAGAVVALGACSNNDLSRATFGLMGARAPADAAGRPAPAAPSAPGTAHEPAAPLSAAPEAAETPDGLEPGAGAGPYGAPRTATVALLLPLSGEDAGIGRDMLRGAEMAVFDLAGDRFELRPYDTKGTAEGAKAAVTQAVADGVGLVLGPVFAAQVAAAAPIARAASVNVVSFTNDESAAGTGVFVLGYLVEPQIDAVVDFARAHGVQRFAALVPDSVFGARAAEAIAAATRAHGGELREVITYSDDVKSIDSAVRRLANYDARRAALKQRRAELAGRHDAAALAAIDALKHRDTLGEVDFEALLVPSGNESVRSIAARLPYYDISSAKVRMLGISTWERLDLRTEPALAGAWYATPQSDVRRGFEAQYKAMFKSAPGFLAALAYDATAVAALLAGREGGPDFGVTALTDPRGFDGASGLFRFRPDGRSERFYAVSEIDREGIKLVRGARRTFEETAAERTEPGRPAIW